MSDFNMFRIQEIQKTLMEYGMPKVISKIITNYQEDLELIDELKRLHIYCLVEQWDDYSEHGHDNNYECMWEILDVEVSQISLETKINIVNEYGVYKVVKNMYDNYGSESLFLDSEFRFYDVLTFEILKTSYETYADDLFRVELLRNIGQDKFEEEEETCEICGSLTRDYICEYNEEDREWNKLICTDCTE